MELQHKKIETCERVCLRLKQAREDAGVSLDDMAGALKISKEHLSKLENCEFDALPFARIYQKNLIKAHLNRLSVDPIPYLQQFAFEECRNDEPNGQVGKHRAYHRLPNLPLLLRGASVAAVVIAVLAYLLLQVQHIVEPPLLLVFGPEDGFISRSGMVEVQGKTDTGAQLFINGTSITNDENGFFNQTVPLAEGVNTIVLSAKKRHGKQISLTRHVMYKAEQGLTARDLETTSL